jgi:hypothetical protein
MGLVPGNHGVTNLLMKKEGKMPSLREMRRQAKKEEKAETAKFQANFMQEG